MFDSLDRITYKAGDRIFREGDTGDCAYLIESGSVEVSITRGDETYRVNILGVNDLFGEMALIDKRPRMATVTALDETRVIRISRSLIEEKLSGSDPLIAHLLRLVLKRFRQSHFSLMEKDQPAYEETDKEFEDALSRTQENLIMNVRIASDIKDALQRDQFQLYYQPIISTSDNKLVGFEALSRWLHPEYGMITPTQFIDIAEYTDQTLAIGIWSLQQICRDYKKFPVDSGNLSRQAMFISVNLSARQLVNAKHVAQFSNIINGAGIDPDCIRFEVSETLLTGQLKQVKMILSALRGQGFRLSLDKFGTGYSSLSLLQKFPVENIKIDMSFISHMLTDYESMQIVTASISLARALDMEVTAEGVEDAQILGKLLTLECPYAQGYYISKPLPLKDAIEYMNQHR